MAVTADNLHRVDRPGSDDPAPQPLRLQRVGPQLVRQVVQQVVQSSSARAAGL